MPIDHDQIFKTLFESFFEEFMNQFFPSEAALLDFNRTEVMREVYFTDIPKGKRRALDLVFKVGTKEGTEKFLLIHTEFESDRPKSGFSRRMYRYFCQLFLRYDIEIVPIAIFTDDAVWREAVEDTFVMEIAGTRFVEFRYHQLKLKRLNYREFLDSRNPLTYTLMTKMDYDRSDQVRLKAEFLRLILSCRVDPARQSLLIDFVETYMPLAEQDEEAFLQIVQAEQQYEEVEQVLTTYERRGIEKGIEKGIEQGIEQGIEAMLRFRFGAAGLAMMEEIRPLSDVALLTKILEQATLVSTPEDLRPLWTDPKKS